MESFFKSNHCKSNRHCSSCRNIDNEEFRKSIFEAYDDVTEVNFECPFKKPWGATSEKPKKESSKKQMLDGKYIMANLDKFSYVKDIQLKADKVNEKINKAKCTRCTKGKELRAFADYVVSEMKAMNDYSGIEGLRVEDTYVIYKNKGYFLKDWLELK
jgi:hypothetical protein